jgi:rare lipoprotein A
MKQIILICLFLIALIVKYNPAPPFGASAVKNTQVPAHVSFTKVAYADEEEMKPQKPDTSVLIAKSKPNISGTGKVSFYAHQFHGRRTANGERFNMYALTAAHKTLPFGSRVYVVNPTNGKTVWVRINDRGPYVGERKFDLSLAAAQKIGIVKQGTARVQYQVFLPEKRKGRKDRHIVG